MEPAADDALGVRAGHPVFACSCVSGHAASARRPVRLKKVVWRSWSSSFSAPLVAAPDPRSAALSQRSVCPARLPACGASHSRAAAARVGVAVLHRWSGLYDDADSPNLSFLLARSAFLALIHHTVNDLGRFVQQNRSRYLNCYGSESIRLFRPLPAVGLHARLAGGVSGGNHADAAAPGLPV